MSDQTKTKNDSSSDADQTKRGAAISREGDESERLFQSIVSHATVPSEGAAFGDVRIVVGNEVHYLEIKCCRSSSGGTLNQVRAMKYIPLVVHLPNQSPNWMVIPPNKIVEIMADRKRGQHTEIPFESAALSVKSLGSTFGCEQSDLEKRVVDAIKEGQSFPTLRQAMVDLKRDIRRLGAHAKMDVKAIVDGSFEKFHGD